jgi:ABC-type Fe3+/spermidine/putrescine transport system ATPase subunit
MMIPFLEITGLAKRFGEIVAVEGVSLSLERGSVLSLLGPSGCGKTTTLRLLAGFEEADRGHVRIDGEDVTGVAPVDRRFGMVFQNYALFPHLDVGGNVAFGLESRSRLPRKEIDHRVALALVTVDLSGFERRRVGELSGGQQQRVALARALAPEPRVLLLDEPLSNLDPALRERTRIELRQLVRRIGITTVLVTHEQEEAFDLGDRVAVLRAGRLEQEGTPEDLYDRPANAFVAGFVGRASELAGTVVATGPDGRTTVRVEDTEWNLTPSCWDSREAVPPGGRVIVSIRPEGFALVSASPVTAGVLVAEVVHRRFRGARCLLTVKTAGGVAVEVEAGRAAAALGSVVGLVPAGERGIHLFPVTERGAREKV